MTHLFDCLKFMISALLVAVHSYSQVDLLRGGIVVGQFFQVKHRVLWTGLHIFKHLGYARIMGWAKQNY